MPFVKFYFMFECKNLQQVNHQIPSVCSAQPFFKFCTKSSAVIASFSLKCRNRYIVNTFLRVLFVLYVRYLSKWMRYIWLYEVCVMDYQHCDGKLQLTHSAKI
jgi:hypothetical protein